MDKTELGSLIQKRRKEKKITQSQLAQRLHVSRTTISKWETGTNRPDLSTLKELSDILDLELYEPAVPRASENYEICEFNPAVSSAVSSADLAASYTAFFPAWREASLPAYAADQKSSLKKAAFAMAGSMVSVAAAISLILHFARRQ